MSFRLSPASTRIRVRAVAIKVELPELLLARMQIFRMGRLRDSFCRVGGIETKVKRSVSAIVLRAELRAKPSERSNSPRSVNWISDL